MSNLYKIAKSDKAVLKVFYDEDAESTRKWDNLGTMVCWHRRYNLGDKHTYGSPEEFLQELANELFGCDDVDYIQRKTDEYMKGCEVRYDAPNDEYDVWENGSLYDGGFETEDDAILELEHIRQNFIDDIYENLSNDELLELIGEKAVILPLYLYDHGGITMSTGSFGDRWDSGQVGWIYVTKDRLAKEGLSHRTTEEIEQYLKGEVEIYDQYLRGNVYGYSLEIAHKCECCNHVEYEEIDSCWGYYGDEGIEDGLKDSIPEEYQHLVDELQYA
jgi:hypothetical protein